MNESIVPVVEPERNPLISQDQLPPGYIFPKSHSDIRKIFPNAGQQTYPDWSRLYACECWMANELNYKSTSEALGIPRKTLTVWAKQFLPAQATFKAKQHAETVGNVKSLDKMLYRDAVKFLKIARKKAEFASSSQASVSAAIYIDKLIKLRELPEPEEKDSGENFLMGLPPEAVAAIAEIVAKYAKKEPIDHVGALGDQKAIEDAELV
jgi:hypothetical protein